MNGKKQAAPFRMIMVKDAISDLPVIKGDGSDKERPYRTKPVTAYQVFMREQQDVVRDHVTRVLGELVQFRSVVASVLPPAVSASSSEYQMFMSVLTRSNVVQTTRNFTTKYVALHNFFFF
jgi:hypothetical protein